MRYLILFPVLLMLLVACGESPTKEDNALQEQIQEKVRNQRPIPVVEYSQTYETVIKWMERWSVQNKVSYVYVLADTGQMIGYYVSQGRPVNVCTFLTSPDKVFKHDYGNLALTAPALDGVYYGNGGCDSWYFFTADTDAFVEIGGGMKFFVTDQPLSIEVEQLTVVVD